MMLGAVENGGIINISGGGGGESIEDGFSVLPPHTKVVVTGNNRTKSVLVGLQGVVQKAVGLGGWHWLILANGIEVKLQRNALSVIETPTGLEDDNYFEGQNLQWNAFDMGFNDTQRSHRPRNHPHQPVESYGNGNATCSAGTFSDDSQSKGSVSPAQSSMKIDLSKLEMTALLRYWRHFKLVKAFPKPSREQLIDVVQRHFMSQQLDELQVLEGFMQAAKRLKTVHI